MKPCRLLPLLPLLLLAGCNSSTPSPTSAELTVTPAPQGGEAAPVAEKSYTGKPVAPPKGLGNAQGRVMFNGKPAVGIEVKLCEHYSAIMGTCGGKSFRGKTDKEGNYVIDKVSPGEYTFMARVFDSDFYEFLKKGFVSADTLKIEDGKSTDVPLMNLYKLDLQVSSPKAGEIVKTGMPKLSWKAYPGAVSYDIDVRARDAGGISQTMKSATNSVQPESALLNGIYTWTVKANNAAGEKIAETPTDDTPFKVTGQVGAATVSLLNPKTGSSVPAAGLVFKWGKHPLADGYQIYLNKANETTPILSFENVAETSYTPKEALGAGQYYWSVNAMKGGNKVAESGLQSFTVK